MEVGRTPGWGGRGVPLGLVSEGFWGGMGGRRAGTLCSKGDTHTHTTHGGAGWGALEPELPRGSFTCPAPALPPRFPPVLPRFPKSSFFSFREAAGRRWGCLGATSMGAEGAGAAWARPAQRGGRRKGERRNPGAFAWGEQPQLPRPPPHSPLYSVTLPGSAPPPPIPALFFCRTRGFGHPCGDTRGSGGAYSLGLPGVPHPMGPGRGGVTPPVSLRPPGRAGMAGAGAWRGGRLPKRTPAAFPHPPPRPRAGSSRAAAVPGEPGRPHSSGLARPRCPPAAVPPIGHRGHPIHRPCSRSLGDPRYPRPPPPRACCPVAVPPRDPGSPGNLCACCLSLPPRGPRSCPFPGPCDSLGPPQPGIPYLSSSGAVTLSPGDPVSVLHPRLVNRTVKLGV